MLDFFSNYPLGHYLKSMGRTPNPPKIGLYLSRDATMMLLRKKTEYLYWNGSLKEIIGAPSLESTEEQKGEKLDTATPYKREVFKKLNINKNNQLHIIIDDAEAYTSSYTVTNFENAEDLIDALERDPSSIITSWKNYTQNDEYLWEILGPDMNILRGPSRLPKKVLLCGFPAKRAEATAKWAADQGQELSNLIPATAAILRWGVKEGPQDGFFLLTQTTTEIVISYFEKGELKLFSGQRTKEGFGPDEINDLNELAEESKGKNSTVWCWGISPGTPPHTRLAGRYKNLRTITPEDLRGVYPIELPGKETRIQEKEAWLLDNILEEEK